MESTIGDEKFIWGLIIGAVITFLIKDIILVNVSKGIKFLSKKTFFILKEKYLDLRKRYKKYKKNKQYYKRIKLIENKKIDPPDHFLAFKNPEKNPELKTIFEMIERGEIEKPKGYMTKEERETLDEARKDILEKIRQNKLDNLPRVNNIKFPGKD